jgi:hypothetical protein
MKAFRVFASDIYWLPLRSRMPRYLECGKPRDQ